LICGYVVLAVVTENMRLMVTVVCTYPGSGSCKRASCGVNHKVWIHPDQVKDGMRPEWCPLVEVGKVE